MSRWADVSAIVAAGGTPDWDDIEYLLRLGESVPPDVQVYFADHGGLVARAKGKGRPKKHPGQISSDGWQRARRLYDAINSIRIDRRISLAQAFKEHAAIRKSPESVEHEYRAAKKLLVADLEQLNTPEQRWFLSPEDRDSWIRKSVKKRKNN